MAFDSEEEIRIRIKVDSAGAVSVLGTTKSKVDELGDSAKKASDSGDKLALNIAKISKIALGAVASISAVAIALGKFAELGDSVQNAEKALDQLAAKVGTTGEKIRNSLSQAFDGAFKDSDLSKFGARGIALGVDPKDLETLAKAAKATSDAFGTDLRGEFDRFITSYSKGMSTALESSLGFIEIEKRQTSFAASVGRAGQELSEQGKLLVAQQAILEAARVKTEELGTTGDTAGAAYGRFTASLGNLGETLAVATTNSGTLVTIFDTLATSINTVRRALEDLIPKLNFGDVISKTPLAQTLGLDSALKSLEAFSKFAAIGEKIQSGGGGKGNLGEDIAALFGLSKATEEVAKATDKAGDSVGKFAGKVDDLFKPLKKAEKEVELFGEEMLELFKLNQRLQSFEGIQGTISQFQSLFRALEQGTVTGGQFNQFFDNLLNDLRTGGIDEGEIGRRIAEAVKGGLKDAEESTSSDFQKFFEESLGLDASQASALGSTVAQTISGALNGAFEGDSNETIGGVTSALAGIADAIIPGLGQVVQVIGDGIKKIFGKSEKAVDKERKSLDKAFNDLLVNNPAIRAIDGIQDSIDDLTLQPAVEEVDRFANSLNDVEKNAINAVAVAFEQISAEFGVNVDEIRGLLNNAFTAFSGGNLLNLKALIKSLGKDATDLGEALFEAFRVGGISASELITLLQGLQTAFSDGIPGIQGAIDQAFQSFETLAAKGGTSAIEAVKALAVEAAEANITTFEALADQLVNQYGFSAQQVQALFDALRAAGVNTLADLAQASEATGIAILSNFQNILAGVGQLVTGAQVEALLPKRPSSGGGGRSAADEAKSAASNALNAASATEDYIAALNSLEAGLITQGQFQKIVNGLVKDYNSLTERREKLETKLAEIIARGGKITAQQARELNRLNKELDTLGKQGEKSVIDVNKAFLNFAKQFAGDANLIGLGLDALGVSLDSLKEPIVNAFRAGKLSAAEALKELEKYEQGLGTTGETAKEAFENFLKGGTSGGAFTIDALKDIAAEAIKAGGSELFDLESQLIEQGLSRQDATGFFKALQDQGITSLEQLAAVTDETALKIIGNAEKFGTPFKKTSDDISSLLKQLEKIRSQGPVKVRITADMDPKLTQLLNLLGTKNATNRRNPGRPNLDV